MESDTSNASYCTDPKFGVEVVKSGSEQCDICWYSEIDSLRYGEFIVKDDSGHKVKCHYFCLLTGSEIPQRGSATTGMLGFRTNDVVKSYTKFRDVKCTYCQQPSTPIRCAETGCSRSFHYICGYKNRCVTQFLDRYISFCDQHLPDEQRKPRNAQDQICEICYEPFPRETDEGYNPVAIMFSCRVDDCPDDVVHRECVQRYAYSAGYSFRCPLCCEKNDYADYARRCGIFVPQQDASWEREPGAYADLHKSKCKSADCAGEGTSKSYQYIGCKICGARLQNASSVDSHDFCKDCKDLSFDKLI